MLSNNTYIITEQQRSNFKPTYLYIKQHSITGLKYFGKTSKKDPYSYNGSGKYWINHIKKHGKQIKSLWVHLFTDIDELIFTALTLSEVFDIVESDYWANQIPENGIDGLPTGYKHSKQTIKQISNKQLYNWSKSESNYNNKRNIKCSIKKIEQWDNLLSNYNTQEYRIKQQTIKEKLYQIQNPNGDIFLIKGLKQFCVENNLSHQNMYKVAKGKRKHHKGWKCIKINV